MSERIVPGKRLRHWHRRYARFVMPLREFARHLARLSETDAQRRRGAIARAWLSGKGIRP